MSIYVILRSDSEKFVEATRDLRYAKRLVKRLNGVKSLTEDGIRYEIREVIDII